MVKSEQSQCHVVVVGAGILGASVAFHLTLRGAQVTLVDAAEPGRGATKISFAWLNAYAKEPFHYHDLNRRSLEMWARFGRRLGVEPTWGGELRWSVTSAGAEELIEQAKRLQAWGYPTRIIDAAEVKRLEPNLQIDQMTAASYSDLEGHIDTGQLIQACLTDLDERGAEIYTQSPVTGLQVSRSEADDARVEAVQLGDRAILCDVAVLAGGADMSVLARMAGVEVPVYHTFGATVLTEPVVPLFENVAVLHHPRDDPPLINFRQFPDDTVMIQGGSSDVIEVGDRGATDDEAAQIMVDAAAVFPALQDAKIKEVQRGRRPIPQDGHPIIGFSETVSNLYLATTHSGVTLAPIIGEFAAIEIVDGVEVDLLQPYRLARFTA